MHAHYNIGLFRFDTTTDVSAENFIGLKSISTVCDRCSVSLKYGVLTKIRIIFMLASVFAKLSITNKVARDLKYILHYKLSRQKNHHVL